MALSGSVTGVGHSASAPLPQSAFSPLPSLATAYPTVAPTPSPTPKPTPKPTLKPTPKPTNKPVVNRHRLTGEASWGPFGGHVVTRLKRGTPITVCGKKGCWSGRSWGYGPAKWTGRIADLDREVFRDICGDPYLLGVCQVRLSWR